MQDNNLFLEGSLFLRHCEAHEESSIEEKCLLRHGNLLIRRLLKRCRYCEAHDESSIEGKSLLRRGNLFIRRMDFNRKRLPSRRRKSSNRLTFFTAPRKDVLGEEIALKVTSLRGA